MSSGQPVASPVSGFQRPGRLYGVGVGPGDHVGVAQDRRAGVERRSRRADQAGVHLQVTGQVGLTGAVHHPHGESLGVRRNAGQVGLAADGRERVDVDLRAVVDVGLPGDGFRVDGAFA